MATRNERKRKAKAKHLELTVAVEAAFALEKQRVAERQALETALSEVNKWTRKGTRTMSLGRGMGSMLQWK